MQDVFFSLYRKCDRIDARRGLRPYLFRMARNRCYDELRRQGRFQSVSLDEEPEGKSFSLAETLPDPAEPTDELAHWLFIQLVVREAMEKLPENQRQALILYAEEQMSYAEIALATNTNPRHRPFASVARPPYLAPPGAPLGAGRAGQRADSRQGAGNTMKRGAAAGAESFRPTLADRERRV